MSEELRKAAENMLNAKSCPDRNCCNDGIVPVGSNEDGWEPSQCEWCYTQEDSDFNRRNELRQALAATEQSEPVAWDEALAVSNEPAIDTMIKNLIEDSTEDNAVCLVRAIMDYTHPPKHEPTLAEVYAELESVKFDNRQLRAVDNGERWMWQPEDDNHLESLSSPIVIMPEDLRQLLKHEPLSDELLKIKEAFDRSFCPVCNKEPFNGVCDECSYSEKFYAIEKAVKGGE